MRNLFNYGIAFYNIGIWFIPIENALKGISVFLGTIYIGLKIYQEFIKNKGIFKN